MKRAGSKGKTTASFLALCAGLMQQKGEALNNVGSTEMRERKLDCTIGGDEGRYILMVAENLTPWSLSFIMVGELTGSRIAIQILRLCGCMARTLRLARQTTELLSESCDNFLEVSSEGLKGLGE